jgi:hypothetical protein
MVSVAGAILAIGLMTSFNFVSRAQTAVQTAIANAQTLAAEEPLTNKAIPVVANPSDSPLGT